MPQPRKFVLFIGQREKCVCLPEEEDNEHENRVISTVTVHSFSLCLSCCVNTIYKKNSKFQMMMCVCVFDVVSLIAGAHFKPTIYCF